jgi:alkaline phosphatase D
MAAMPTDELLRRTFLARTKVGCADAAASSQTMLGPEQERWFLNGLTHSRARWNIVANQVAMMQIDHRAGPEIALSMDKWDGYQAARTRVLQHIAEHRIANAVVITGDIHSNWVGDLKVDFSDPKSPVVGTEFIGTSITSGADGSDTTAATEAFLPDNPHIKFFNTQRGYVRCVVTPVEWRTDYQVLPFVTRPGSPIATRASFVVESGRPGAQKA